MGLTRRAFLRWLAQSVALPWRVWLPVVVKNKEVGMPVLVGSPVLYRVGSAIQADLEGDERGAQAVDLQQTRDASTEVASGLYAVALGVKNTAAGTATVAAGQGNSAAGSGAAAVGLENSADGIGAVAVGYKARATLPGQAVAAGGWFAAAGDAQGILQAISRAAVTPSGTTWYPLYTNGSSSFMAVPTDTLWAFDILVAGLTSGAAQQWAYQITGAIVNDGGTATLLNSTVTTLYAADANYEVAVIANTDDLIVRVRNNGGTAYTARWVAVVRAAVVAYP